jgi:hypothetical protein
MITTVLRVSLTLAAVAQVAGCASVSDVVPTGPDTFMVAMQTANSYCLARAKQMQVIHVESVEPFFGRAPSADINFRCEASGTPSVQR